MVEQQEEQLHRQESSSGPRVEAWTADVAPALALGTALPGALPVGATTGWGAGAPLPQQPPSHSTAASARERAAADAFLAAAMGVWQPHAEWERLRPTLAAWLVASVINFVILTRAAFNGFLLAIISAVLGFTASLRVALPSCRGERAHSAVLVCSSSLDSGASHLGSEQQTNLHVRCRAGPRV